MLRDCTPVSAITGLLAFGLHKLVGERHAGSNQGPKTSNASHTEGDEALADWLGSQDRDWHRGGAHTL